MGACRRKHLEKDVFAGSIERDQRLRSGVKQIDHLSIRLSGEPHPGRAAETYLGVDLLDRCRRHLPYGDRHRIRDVLLARRRAGRGGLYQRVGIGAWSQRGGDGYRACSSSVKGERLLRP
ncbi:hypothetical protein D9M72_283410 [compost metagenome]